MSKNRKINFLVISVMLVLNVAFGFFYNASVSKVVTEAAYNDYSELQNRNIEIVERLKQQKDTSYWNDIVNQYEENIYIFDRENTVIAKTENMKSSAFDVKVRTPFDFNGEVYLLRTSAYLLRNYVGESRGVVKFVIVELIIGITALAIFVLIIYSFMLRPFRVVYKAIEEYDRSGTLIDIKLKGFAGRVYRRFASMAKNLDKQQQNQKRIIASISHDIKTPLTSIMGYSEQLKKDNLSPERRERYLNTVYDKAVDIRTLVDEFDEYLGYNRNYGMKKSRITIEEIEKCLINDYADDFSQAGIDFKIINRAGKDAEIYADVQRLKRVGSNIFTNSVKHFKDGEKKIRVDIFYEHETITMKFSDNGEGVPEDKLEMIFEPLYTSDEGRKVAGLGLSICREIVEAHGGKIYAEKSDLGGLAICVELPGG